MTRQTLTPPERLDAAQKAAYDSFTAARPAQADGSLGGPFDAWLTNPELFDRLRGLGGMLWERTSLDRGLIELAICVTAQVWAANYEWAAHAPRAVAHGVPRSVLDDLLARRPCQGTAEQQLVCEICLSLHEARTLNEPLYTRAVAMFGERGLAELIAVAGFYGLVSMTLNAFDVQVPAGLEAPFARQA